MTPSKFTISAVLLLILPAIISAMCSYREADIVESGGKQYCVYKDRQVEVGGKERDDEDCYDVSCDHGYLFTCGFGRRAGIMRPPYGCKIAFQGTGNCFVKIIQHPRIRVKCPVISD